MLGSALVIFAIGALGGIALASFVLRERLGEFVPGYEATVWTGIGAPKVLPVSW